jgi:hypothetical protein
MFEAVSIALKRADINQFYDSWALARWRNYARFVPPPQHHQRESSSKTREAFRPAAVAAAIAKTRRSHCVTVNARVVFTGCKSDCERAFEREMARTLASKGVGPRLLDGEFDDIRLLPIEYLSNPER